MPRSGAWPGRARRRAAPRGRSSSIRTRRTLTWRLRHPLAEKLRRVLRVDAEGDTYFAQTDGRCPFLCADGLCELQRTLGEQSLCRTCRDFPRWEVLLCDRWSRDSRSRARRPHGGCMRARHPCALISAQLPDDGYVPGARERRLTAAVTAVRDRVLALLVRPGHTAEENLAAALDFARAAQRQLDRHRIAALAAGNVPAVTADAALEPMAPAALAAAFASPEPLDARWPELLRRVAALDICPPPRLTDVQQICLAQTIVWRHGMDALDDRDVVFPARYAAATLRLLDCLATVSSLTDAQLIVLVTREMENDPEALSRLRAGLQITIKKDTQEAYRNEKM